MNYFLKALILLMIFPFFSAQNLSKEGEKIVLSFIKKLNNREVEILSKNISYPLNRDYPLMDIEDEYEFQARFYEIFDEEMLKEIIQSNLTNDWTESKGSGYSFKNGKIWLDQYGNLLFINHESDYEKKLKLNLIEWQKLSLPENLRDFTKPITVMEIPGYRIRIDLLSNGYYRYTAWLSDQTSTAEPLLIINDGKLKKSNISGNYEYIFKEEIFTYLCDINTLPEHGKPKGSLIVYENDKIIGTHQATRVIH